MPPATEASPLLPQHNEASPSSGPTPNTSQPQRVSRTVTFNPLTTAVTQSGSTTPGPSLRPSHSPSQTLAAGSTIGPKQTPAKEPVLSAFNSKLRRRNSHGAALPTKQPFAGAAPRLGAQRTSRTAEKLKLLPNPDYADEGPDEESGRDVYAQFTRIKDPNARRDAARLGKSDRDRLPRVTAYCVAQGYRLEGVMKFMKSRTRTRGANPKLFDECLYTPYNYDHQKKVHEEEQRRIQYNEERQERRRESRTGGSGSGGGATADERLARIMSSPRLSERERRYSDSAIEVEDHTKTRREDLIDLQEELDAPAIDDNPLAPLRDEAGGLLDVDSQQALEPLTSRSSTDLAHHREQDELHDRTNSELSTEVHTPEVFVFDYGTLVLWGMTLEQENRFLADLSKFAESPLPVESVQTEEFNFYYTKEYQARIYNDFISLRDPKHNMTKLAISHALSQSVKTSLFEDLVSETIDTTSPLPALIASTGSVNLTDRQLNMQIGELFILRINIHLQGSVLDSPELMWAEPQLEPVYAAVRSYLEIGQRVELLNERLDVIADLLAVLREQGSRRHGEVLEWIVIVLIAVEIIVAAINIVVDIWAGGD